MTEATDKAIQPSTEFEHSGRGHNYRLLDVSGCNIEQKSKIFEYAADVRKFEIERFWHRSLFFWGFITTALVAYGAATKDYPRLQFIAACYGFLCSLAWSLQNRGSKYWHESWELKVEQVERDILGTNLFSNKEPIKNPSHWLSAMRYSSSKLVMALGDITCFTWLTLVVLSMEIDLNAPIEPMKFFVFLLPVSFLYT